jgi:predicted nucleic acid-binding protein
MTTYFDTGQLLKLYTSESASEAVEAFVRRRAKPLPVHALHLAEMTSVLRLKQFRGECRAGEADRALACIDDDLDVGILRAVPLDWDDAWRLCRELSRLHADTLGCRTLDTLHVACAIQLRFGEFATSDARQAGLARRCKLRVVNHAERLMT